VNIIPARLSGVFLLQPVMHRDARGFFMESFNRRVFGQLLGLEPEFVQINHSHSRRGVLRGLHYQITKPQGKLVKVVRGEIFDVVVDLRPQSATFGTWESFQLSEQNQNQLWVPPGFAHGFAVVSEDADVIYGVTDYYDPVDERCIVWNDVRLGIPWPVQHPLVSRKDAQGLTLAQAEAEIRNRPMEAGHGAAR